MLRTIEEFEARRVDLPARGIDEAQAAGLRARLITFAADWDRAEMDVYDDYDSARAKLPEGAVPRTQD